MIICGFLSVFEIMIDLNGENYNVLTVTFESFLFIFQTVAHLYVRVKGD